MEARLSRPGVAFPRFAPLDATGVVLVLAFAAWTIVCVSALGGDALPSLGILFGASAAYGIARAVGARRAWLPPVLVLVVAGVLAVAAGQDAINGRALSDPLGYANANGALWAQAAATSVLLAVSSVSKIARAAAVGAGLLFAGLTLASGSLAAAALLSVVVVAAITGRNETARKWFVLGAAALAGMALWTSVVLGVGYRFEIDRPPSQQLAEESLSTRRLVLWRDASDLIARHPLLGVGPRRFGEESEIARADPDTTEAHNEFLQQGAETGVVGLMLMILLFGWAFVRIARTPGAPSAIAGAAVAMLAIHATVDYILHFPIVPIVTAAMVGASATMRRTRPPEGDRVLN